MILIVVDIVKLVEELISKYLYISSISASLNYTLELFVTPGLNLF